MKHVVLNCANIGCTYGENVLKRTKGQNKFDWRGVEDAYNYYEGAPFCIHVVALSATSPSLSRGGWSSACCCWQCYNMYIQQVCSMTISTTKHNQLILHEIGYVRMMLCSPCREGAGFMVHAIIGQRLLSIVASQNSCRSLNPHSLTLQTQSSWPLQGPEVQPPRCHPKPQTNP